MKLETIIVTMDELINLFENLMKDDKSQDIESLENWRSNISNKISGVFFLVRNCWIYDKELEEVNHAKVFSELENRYQDDLSERWRKHYERIADLIRTRTIEIAAEVEEEWSSVDPDEWEPEEMYPYH
ncbi:hypothetical protein [Methylomonas albis]|uniref:Uncharacterized protein n=1 Tax=Methylomonas albis TaxID=1854563 RepID=A0ABR9D2Z2_9GAMM|nr:hypothetical protein [Methylomonas albis]MBD9357485.1 hypothetical protein [Methylomonas albis]